MELAVADQGDADAGAHLVGAPVEHDRAGDAGGEPAGDRERHFRADDRGRDHREFVPAQSRRAIAVAHGIGDAARRRAQDRVAGGVAVRVVDCLEAVEIQHEHRGEPLRRRSVDQPCQRLVKGAAIGHAGERVVIAKIAHAVLGLDPPHALAFARAMLVQPEAEQQEDQGRGEEQELVHFDPELAIRDIGAFVAEDVEREYAVEPGHGQENDEPGAATEQQRTNTSFHGRDSCTVTVNSEWMPPLGEMRAQGSSAHRCRAARPGGRSPCCAHRLRSGGPPRNRPGAS